MHTYIYTPYYKNTEKCMYNNIYTEIYMIIYVYYLHHILYGHWPLTVMLRLSLLLGLLLLIVACRLLLLQLLSI